MGLTCLQSIEKNWQPYLHKTFLSTIQSLTPSQQDNKTTTRMSQLKWVDSVHKWSLNNGKIVLLCCDRV